MSRRVIWKFTVDAWSPTTAMPKGARILHIREQSAKVRPWAEVDPDATIVGRKLAIGLTGGSPPPHGEYIGTAIVNEDGLEIVVHVYDQGEEV